jgi:hypothetical protein
VPKESWSLVEVVVGGGTATFYQNGVNLGSGSWTGSINFNELGGTWSGSPNQGAIIGQVAEIAVFNKALTDAERQNVEDAMNAKYALGKASPGGVAPGDCVSWWRADSLSLADGDSVSSWPNSADGGPTASAASNQPIFKTNVINGKPVVRFSGLGPLSFNASALPMGGSDRTVTVAVKCANAIGTPGAVLYYGTFGTNGGVFDFGFTTVNDGGVYFHDYGHYNTTGVNQLGSWHIVTVKLSKGQTCQLYVDGVQQLSNSFFTPWNTFGTQGAIGKNNPTGDNKPFTGGRR